MNLGRRKIWQVEREHFVRDDARTVEGMVKPEIGCERMVTRQCDYAVFERVAGLEAEDADGFYAYIVVGGKLFDGGIRRIGNCTRKNVCCATACVRDVHQRNFHGLEAAVVIEVQPRELTNTKFAIDFDECVHFFSRIAVRFDTIFCFEQVNLRCVRRFGRLFLPGGDGFLFRLFRCRLRKSICSRKQDTQAKKYSPFRTTFAKGAHKGLYRV